MSLYHGTSMEQRQQAADANWERLERRETDARFREIDFTTDRLPPETERGDSLRDTLPSQNHED